jgi:hypothetical protein
MNVVKGEHQLKFCPAMRKDECEEEKSKSTESTPKMEATPSFLITCGWRWTNKNLELGIWNLVEHIVAKAASLSRQIIGQPGEHADCNMRYVNQSFGKYLPAGLSCFNRPP